MIHVAFALILVYQVLCVIVISRMIHALQSCIIVIMFAVNIDLRVLHVG